MIAVHQLGKRYKRYRRRWARLGEWLSGGRWAPYESRWVLRGVSFDVRAGEAVGVVGANGAGKSTLLKILAGTTWPSSGSFAVGGRVAALLELGLGFHPDFSGRQNAVIGCQMLGMGPADVRARLPEIADFAELDDAFDEPLRSYSTGMQMRLAFSVATAVRSDVLIVDEALSVGDAYFQHKSIHRIRAFREQGTTVLFVSHDLAAVTSLCDRALLLDQGALVHQGPPDAVIDYYNALVAQREGAADIRQSGGAHGHTVTRSGSGLARIAAVDITDAAAQPRQVFRVGDVARLCCRVDFFTAVDRPTVGILIRDRLGNHVFGTNSYHLERFVPQVAPGDSLLATFTVSLNIGPGSYSVSVAVHTERTHHAQNFDWWDRALVFEVVPNESYHFIGTARLPVELHLDVSRRVPSPSGRGTG
jgi:lipopolysaccharide transport system ATP-binding protein